MAKQAMKLARNEIKMAQDRLRWALDHLKEDNGECQADDRAAASLQLDEACASMVRSKALLQ